MKKGICALILGLLLSFFFSFVFFVFQDQSYSSTVDVYYLQVGVYQTKENAINMQLELSSKEIYGYVYEDNDMYYVICAICQDLEELKTYETQLTKNGLSYVRKEKTIADFNQSDDLAESLLEAVG